ncbi:MFS transporter [Flavihumibacter profundi]|uniref:MFS transporter n=1 Tax=Flavihumibacter profundi TaxID=2716883 RepID=UPI001CC41C3F|nr:MFS transporter [Flavihumibacter profundi]MBZ5855619.1 MFS transporter [Flavihumibacter profundi]
MPSEKITIGQYKVAATGFLSLFSIIGIMFYGLPFFFDFWVNDFGWNRATVTSGNIFGKIIIGPLFGFAAGWIVDRFGPKRLMLFGIVISGLAVIGLSKMHSLFEFYSLYMLMVLGYMCGGPLPNQVMTSRWFNNSRGKAMGFSYLGVGIGGMLVPQIAKWLNKQMDWRLSLVVLGILMLVVALPMALFVKENPGDVIKAAKAGEPTIPFSAILKNKSFYFLALGSMCSIGAITGVSQNLKLFFSLDLHYSQGQAANVVSGILGASIIGRLLMGWLADRYPKKHVMMLIYMLNTLSILLLYFVDTPGLVYFFVLVFGISIGGDYMIIPLMAAELFGIKVMGRVMGLILTVDGLAEAFGPVLAGWLRDRNGSYAIGFTALILLSVIGTLAIWMLPGKKLLNR